MKFLFLFSIPNVQNFIEQARKTQDLFAGSELLSDLCKAGIAKAQSYAGTTVIFPTYVEGATVTNRFLVDFELADDSQLSSIGNGIAQAVQDKLDAIIAKYLPNTASYDTAEQFKAQMYQTFSFEWVFSDSYTSYAKAFDEVEKKLGAIKNVRNFDAFSEWGRKCTLIGGLNALIFHPNTNGGLPQYATSKAFKTKGYNLNEGEGLSAPAFVKRRYNAKRHQNFQSTADIALLDAMRKLKVLEENDTTKFLEEFAFTFLSEEGGKMKTIDEIDGQLFYEENYTRKYFEKQNIQVGLLSKAREKWRKIHAVAKRNKIPLVKYYAVLLFDADDMGAWLHGNRIKEGQDLFSFHKAFSKILSSFANEARRLVDSKGYGRTVYAGGDDYLGFINLHHLLDALKELRELFREKVDKQIQPYKANPNQEMTFSAGITIAHYKTPLSEVLQWVRRTEKEAKSTDNKDSFGLSVLKHSGEINKTVMSFQDKNGKWNTENLKYIINQLSEGHFSSKFIQNIERQFLWMGNEVADKDILDSDTYQDLIEDEAKRLIKRAKITKEADVKALTDNALNVYASQGHTSDEWIKSMNICDFVTRKLKGHD